MALYYQKIYSVIINFILKAKTIGEVLYVKWNSMNGENVKKMAVNTSWVSYIVKYFVILY